MHVFAKDVGFQEETKTNSKNNRLLLRCTCCSKAASEQRSLLDEIPSSRGALRLRLRFFGVPGSWQVAEKTFFFFLKGV